MVGPSSGAAQEGEEGEEGEGGEEGEEGALVGGNPSWVVGAWYFVSFKMTSAWGLRPSDLYPAVRSSY